ncbi:MAG: hypothetical protein WKF30_14605 [Pyrinomonadaceae bacterium]
MAANNKLNQLTDTDVEAELVQIEIIRGTPIWKKFAQITALNNTCRLLALADIRRRNPAASEVQLRRLLAARLLPPRLFEEAYGKE